MVCNTAERTGICPLITVIVATFNAGRTLQRCIDSVTGQTFHGIELIVIDGGSKDETTNVLRRNQSAIQYWLSEPDHGVYDAWNKALKAARGQWVCFLGADDRFWEPATVSTMVPHLTEAVRRGIRVVYGNVAVVSPIGAIVRVDARPWQEAKQGLKYYLSVPHAGTFHHRSLFDEFGNFDVTYRIAGDYDFMLRELKHRDAYHASGVVTIAFQEGGMSTRPELGLRLISEIARIREAHGLGSRFGLLMAPTSVKTIGAALLHIIVGAGAVRVVRGLVRGTRRVLSNRL